LVASCARLGIKLTHATAMSANDIVISVRFTIYLASYL
jgi:hypothetical protein